MWEKKCCNSSPKNSAVFCKKIVTRITPLHLLFFFKDHDCIILAVPQPVIYARCIHNRFYFLCTNDKYEILSFVALANNLSWGELGSSKIGNWTWGKYEEL